MVYWEQKLILKMPQISCKEALISLNHIIFLWYLINMAPNHFTKQLFPNDHTQSQDGKANPYKEEEKQCSLNSMDAWIIFMYHCGKNKQTQE